MKWNEWKKALPGKVFMWLVYVAISINWNLKGKISIYRLHVGSKKINDEMHNWEIWHSVTPGRDEQHLIFIEI